MADAKLALSGAAACVAEGATFPLDVLKARLQLHRGREPLGLAATALRVLRHEGPAALYAGIAPALLRHLPYTSIRVALFERLRDRANATWDGRPPPGSTLAAGLVAGGAGQLAAVPADLIKLRMQADARSVAAGQRATPRYRGMAHAFGEILRREGGVSALAGGRPRRAARRLGQPGRAVGV
jgi:solute carrier family 25 uncoupling protein 27